MRTTTLLTCAALCAAVCGVRADVEAKLTRDGHVTFGDTGLALSPTVYAEGWHGTALSRAERLSKFPNAKSGTAAWILKGSRDARLGHGTTRLVAAPDGRAAFRAEFVSDADQKPEGVLLSMNLPASRFGGLGWTADAKKGVFPPSFTSGSFITLGPTDDMPFSSIASTSESVMSPASASSPSAPTTLVGMSR